jgi:hypothetical protein
MRRSSVSPHVFPKEETSGGRTCLQIVENRRDDGAVRQQVIATLGRLEDLRQSGQLERLLRSGARFADKAIVVGAVADGEATTSVALRIGPALMFERLWEETELRITVTRPSLLPGAVADEGAHPVEGGRMVRRACSFMAKPGSQDPPSALRRLRKRCSGP